MINKMGILFVCKYNRFRSRVAESYFNKVNKNISVSSAGIFIGRSISPRMKAEVKKYGIIISGTPRAISSKLLSETDMVIIVADDVPKSLFKFNGKYPQRVIKWSIKDSRSSDKLAVDITVRKIINNIDSLNNKLKEVMK